MRALRDFNTPKIVTDDVPIFMGLIGDLFPALDVPRKRDPDFEACVKKSVLELGLQPEDSFVLKVVQMEELRHVRHSIFVIGSAGTGKTKVLMHVNCALSVASTPFCFLLFFFSYLLPDPAIFEQNILQLEDEACLAGYQPQGNHHR